MAKLFFFYISYLYFPAMALIFWAIAKRYLNSRLIWLFPALGLSVLAYARFVEPRILTVNRTEIVLDEANLSDDTVTFLVFSDTHYGIFRNAMPLQRILKRARKLDFDAVLIPGDLVYHLDSEAFRDTFSWLNDFGKPVYIVYGNHDVGLPGPDVSLKLTAVLSEMENVHLIQNRLVPFDHDGRKVWLMGTLDLWQRVYPFPPIEQLDDAPIIILTHNPDMAFEVPKSIDFDLMIAGHTHGGQIRIPLVYKKAIPTIHPFEKGLYQVTTSGGQKQVFVTSGTGMVGLPMRFLMPPRLDILTVRLPEQQSGDDNAPQN